MLNFLRNQDTKSYNPLCYGTQDETGPKKTRAGLQQFTTTFTIIVSCTLKTTKRGLICLFVVICLFGNGWGPLYGAEKSLRSFMNWFTSSHFSWLQIISNSSIPKTWQVNLQHHWFCRRIFLSPPLRLENPLLIFLSAPRLHFGTSLINSSVAKNSVFEDLRPIGAHRLASTSRGAAESISQKSI